MILQSIPWYRIKGTPASIRAALELFGYGVAFPAQDVRPSGIVEVAFPAQDVPGRAAGAQPLPRQWQATASVAQDVRPSGIVIEENGVGEHWATYQLGLPHIADTATVQHIVTICNEMAPVRCRLWRIYTADFDRRPIIWSGGTRHDRWSEGWWTMHSGVPVPEAPGSGDDLIVSFGTRNGLQSKPYAPRDLAASFGTTTHYGFLAPYIDRPIWSRSAWSDVYPRNHGFAMGSLFFILWADRATAGRCWRGTWDARSWRDYTGFDRKLPHWRMGGRSWSRSQAVFSEGHIFSENNACYSRPTAVILDAPPVWGAARWSAEGRKVHLLVIDERYISLSNMAPKPVTPGVPHVAGTLGCQGF